MDASAVCREVGPHKGADLGGPAGADLFGPFRVCQDRPADGAAALNVPAGRALGHVAGYAICNDAGARGIQRREMESQTGIVRAKNFPGFAPMGPWLTTVDAVGDPQSLRLTLEVDGDIRQDASTADMMFPVAELIARWSRTGLEAGDILITGTPSGVALAREEPAQYYLRPGQTVVARIEKLGELRNPVV